MSVIDLDRRFQTLDENEFKQGLVAIIAWLEKAIKKAKSMTSENLPATLIMVRGTPPKVPRPKWWHKFHDTHQWQKYQAKFDLYIEYLQDSTRMQTWRETFMSHFLSILSTKQLEHGFQQEDSGEVFLFQIRILLANTPAVVIHLCFGNQIKSFSLQGNAFEHGLKPYLAAYIPDSSIESVAQIRHVLMEAGFDEDLQIKLKIQ